VSVIDDIRSAAEQVGQASPKKKTYNTLSKVLSDFELGKKVTRTFARRSIKLG
jgi:hypothetical protein